MFSIIGKGFGVYGYKPALDMLGLKSVTVERGEPITSSHVIVAVPPAEQPVLARELIKNSAIESLLLEKPLAPTPAESKSLLAELKASGKKFRIGYLFSDTKWANPGIRKLYWGFSTYRFPEGRNDWKTRIGIVPLFGIHVIALLADLGYTDVRHSYASESDWTALFDGPDLEPVSVRTDMVFGKDVFRVNDDCYPSPFGNETRTQVLARSIKRFLDNPQPDYGKELDLWEKVAAA